jgi:FtsZ-binding cell division protein ZapB
MNSEVDALGSLEERVRRAVEFVATLKAERDAALEEVAELRQAAGEAERLRTEVESLRAELATLQSERKQVRGRIEKLLGQMEQFGGG